MSTSAPNEAGPRKLKILMLHGYTQSGPLFHAKTRALEKALSKAFPASTPTSTSTKSNSQPPGSLPSFPGGVQLIYPSGPRVLQPADIPNFSSSLSSTPLGSNNNDDSPSTSGASTPIPGANGSEPRAWWVRNDRTGEYEGLEEFCNTVAETIKEAGGVDAVMGFSQGGAASGMVASLLESSRPSAFSAQEPKGGLPFPDAIQKLGELASPLRFFVSYSGFRPPPGWADEKYDAFYDPTIKTPSLHFIGSLDSVVEESRCLALVNACEESNRKVVYHPGGHFVPIGKEWVNVLVGFIREVCGEERKDAVGGGKKNGDIDDDDFPF